MLNKANKIRAILLLSIDSELSPTKSKVKSKPSFNSINKSSSPYSSVEITIDPEVINMCSFLERSNCDNSSLFASTDSTALLKADLFVDENYEAFARELADKKTTVSKQSIHCGPIQINEEKHNDNEKYNRRAMLKKEELQSPMKPKKNDIVFTALKALKKMASTLKSPKPITSHRRKSRCRKTDPSHHQPTINLIDMDVRTDASSTEFTITDKYRGKNSTSNSISNSNNCNSRRGKVSFTECQIKRKNTTKTSMCHSRHIKEIEEEEELYILKPHSSSKKKDKCTRTIIPLKHQSYMKDVLVEEASSFK